MAFLTGLLFTRSEFTRNPQSQRESLKTIGNKSITNKTDLHRQNAKKCVNYYQTHLKSRKNSTSEESPRTKGNKNTDPLASPNRANI